MVKIYPRMDNNVIAKQVKLSNDFRQEDTSIERQQPRCRYCGSIMKFYGYTHNGQVATFSCLNTKDDCPNNLDTHGFDEVTGDDINFNARFKPFVVRYVA
jgi:hypothetical protein